MDEAKISLVEEPQFSEKPNGLVLPVPAGTKDRQRSRRNPLYIPVAEVEGLAPEDRALLAEVDAQFYRKERPQEIPIIPKEEDLKGMFPFLKTDEDAEMFRDTYWEIMRVVTGSAIWDRFGDDHDARTVWRQGLLIRSDEDSKRLYRTYESPNHFRKNVLTILPLDLDFLAYQFFAASNDHPEYAWVSTDFRDRAENLRFLINGIRTGKPYSSMPRNGKIKVVQKTVDQGVYALQRVFRGTGVATRTIRTT